MPSWRAIVIDLQALAENGGLLRLKSGWSGTIRGVKWRFQYLYFWKISKKQERNWSLCRQYLRMAPHWRLLRRIFCRLGIYEKTSEIEAQESAFRMDRVARAIQFGSKRKPWRQRRIIRPSNNVCLNNVEIWLMQSDWAKKNLVRTYELSMVLCAVIDKLWFVIFSLTAIWLKVSYSETLVIWWHLCILRFYYIHCFFRPVIRINFSADSWITLWFLYK